MSRRNYFIADFAWYFLLVNKLFTFCSIDIAGIHMLNTALTCFCQKAANYLQ